MNEFRFRKYKAKPCPHCGAPAKIFRPSSSGDVAIECSAFFTHTAYSDSPDPQGAINSWNTRPRHIAANKEMANMLSQQQLQKAAYCARMQGESDLSVALYQAAGLRANLPITEDYLECIRED